MKIEEIIPKRTLLKLSGTKTVLHLRPVNLEDELWMHETFGKDIQKVFAEIRTRDIARIAYRLIEEKSQFKASTVKIMNEQGDEISERRGGVDLLFCMMLGINDKLAVYRALLEAIGISRPQFDKLAAEEQKKSLKATKKGTGKRSSTS